MDIEELVMLEDCTADLMSSNLPTPELVDYYNRISRREIMLNGGIDINCVDYAKQIMEWNVEDKDTPVEERKPIKIFINSMGGDPDAAYTLIDAMIMSKTPVYVIGMGNIYSAASMVFIAGHKRYIFPHARYMIHDGYIKHGDNVAKMIDDFEFTKKNEENIKEYFISRTKIPAELYDSKYRANWYMFPDDMIEYGVADEILTTLEV